MTTENEQKTAIITGGSKGIGRAICIELARAGCYTAINYRNPLMRIPLYPRSIH